MAPPIEVSIIIVTYNTRELTRQCVESIFHHTQGASFEVLVCDNASSDGSDKVLYRLRKHRYHYLYNRNNIGFSRANNRMARYARGRYLFFLNPDTLLLDDVVSGLSGVLADNPRVGIAGPRFENPDGTLQVSCRRFPNILFGVTRFLPVARYLLPGQVADYYQAERDYTQPQSVDTVSAGALMISRPLFESIGRFDPFSFMYAEDADICRRVRDRGLLVQYCPEVRLRHYGGQSSQLNSYRAIWSYYMAFYQLYKKYYFGRLAMGIKPLFWARAVSAMAMNRFKTDKRVTWGGHKPYDTHSCEGHPYGTPQQCGKQPS